MVDAIAEWLRRNAPAPDLARVLFVCMGNICRSPTAEAVFRTLVEQRGLGQRIAVASAGTHDYQHGQPADVRAQTAAVRRGYAMAGSRARMIVERDFEEFDWILAMDRQNLRHLQAMRPSEFGGHVGLLLELAPALKVSEVPDPYYGSLQDFERVLDLVEPAANALLAAIIARAPTSGPSTP